MVRRVARLIATARSPLVVAGGGVHSSGAVAELAALQEIAHLPVVTTNMGKGAVDESGPLSLGVAANVTGERGPAHFHLPLISGADVVLLVGTRTNENGTEGWTLTSRDATYVHIDVDPLEVGRNYESLRLLGDAPAALADLTAALAATDLTPRLARSEELRATIAAGRQRHFEAVTSLLESGETPIAPERLFAELGRLLDPDDIVVAVGATGIVVDHPDAIAPALRKALNSSHTTVIDMIVDPDPDAYPPVRAFDAFTDRLNAPRHRAAPASRRDNFK